MQIIYHNGFNDADRRTWKTIIFHNLSHAFLEIVTLMKTQGNMKMLDPYLEVRV
jgi:hypothetical protein